MFCFYSRQSVYLRNQEYAGSWSLKLFVSNKNFDLLLTLDVCENGITQKCFVGFQNTTSSETENATALYNEQT